MTTCNVKKSNQQIRNEWLKNQKITYIPIGSVKLTEPIHKNANVDFSKQIKKLRAKGVKMLESPIIVKQEDSYTYSLVTGYKGLCIALALYHTFIPAVIINKSRKEFIKELGFKKQNKWMNISDIKIPRAFRESTVGRHKVRKCIVHL